MSLIRCFVVVTLLLFPCIKGLAQGRFLQKTIETPAFNGSLEQWLLQIERLSGAHFSYNPDQFPMDSIVYLTVKKAVLSQMLTETIRGKISLRERGHHIILIREHAKRVSESKPKEYVVTGYVVNAATGVAIPYATVNLSDKFTATLSNEQGYFSLPVTVKTELISLSVSKETYSDTIVVIAPVANRPLQIPLSPNYEPIQSPPIKDLALNHVGLVKIIVPESQMMQTENINYTLSRPAQISFLPKAGSNSQLSGIVRNNLSFNVLAGYSAGVDGIEIGGLVNVNRYDMNGFQMAGWGNIVGKNTSGIQIGGIFNHTMGSFYGIGIAGIYNLVADTGAGFQLAGVSNIIRGHMAGHQFAGISNLSGGDVNGWQMAGFSNICRGKVSLMQISGFANLSKDVGLGQMAGLINYTQGEIHGFQLSGGVNKAYSLQGVQMAGICNISYHDVEGSQLSGVFNMAGGTLHGTQLAGVANFSNAATTGVEGAGLLNVALAEVDGAQIAGMANFALKGVKGFQASGFINVAAFANVQVAGFGNVVWKNTVNTQLSSIYNIANHVNGAQLTTVYNHCKYLKGLQIGLFNYADSSDGISIGLFSFCRKNGYRAFGMEMDETRVATLSFYSGNRRFYTQWRYGMGIGTTYRGYGWGFGLHVAGKQKTQLWFETNLLQRQLDLTTANSIEMLTDNKLVLKYKLKGRFELTLAPALRHLIYETTLTPSDYPFLNNGTQLMTNQVGNVHINTRAGLGIGLRFRIQNSKFKIEN